MTSQDDLAGAEDGASSPPLNSAGSATVQPTDSIISDADMRAKAGPTASEPRPTNSPKADNFGQLTVAAPQGYQISIDGVLQRATYVGRKPYAPGTSYGHR